MTYTIVTKSAEAELLDQETAHRFVSRPSYGECNRPHTYRGVLWHHSAEIVRCAHLGDEWIAELREPVHGSRIAACDGERWAFFGDLVNFWEAEKLLLSVGSFRALLTPLSRETRDA